MKPVVIDDDLVERPEILVVDDSAENRLAVRAALEGMPHPILEAGSGDEALRILLRRDVAVLLLDVRMPVIDGYETARLIRSRRKSSGVPIIFITAYEPEDKGVLEAYRLGAVDFLFKPLRPEILRAKVSVFVELHQRASEIAQQAARLREHDRRQHEQELAAQRRQFEAAALHREMEEQRRANVHLQQADRRKDEFLAILGHELRNPLVPLVAGLELFKRLDIEDPVVLRAHAAMVRQTDHLSRLVDDLLDVSRVASGSVHFVRAPVELADIVDQAVTMANPTIEERRLDLVVESVDEPVWLDADSVRVIQALSNLLNNAARYTESPGRITLSWRLQGQGVVIRVQDTGCGMDAKLLSRVFDMFAQGRPGAGGLGVGLALTRRFVELHGGTITAHSDGPGTGSTFEITLPTTTAPSEEALPAGRRAAEVTAPAPLRIVVVEDDLDLRNAVGDLLRDWGHRVELIGTGLEGVDAILAAEPDVAVVDIALPDIDGYTVAQRVRAGCSNSRVRLIAMTGFGQERDRRRALAAGFDEHITKPPDLDVLRGTLACRST